MFSEFYLRTHLTCDAYDKWRRHSFYSKIVDGDDWNKSTGSCGSHAQFVVEQLGFPVKEYSSYKEVNDENIEDILKHLDKGHLVDFIHNYKDKDIFLRLPKDNRYGNHEFQIIKGGDKYFLTQGFLHAYKHSLIAYSKDEIRSMLQKILMHLSDYENKKVWGDLDLNNILGQNCFCIRHGQFLNKD